MAIIKELKSFEILGLLAVYAFLCINAFFLHDSIAAIVSAFFGITYTFWAGKGNPICYLFGVIGSSFYGYLAFRNALWGNLILYMCYYVPMQILGFFKWNSHLKEGENVIIKVTLTLKERITLFSIVTMLSVVMTTCLYFLQDKHPIIDGITTVFSIAGMYLTVKRAIEQWLVWIIVNALSVIMWCSIIAHGEKAYSTVIMWSVYFVLAIYFYFAWKKEIQE